MMDLASSDGYIAQLSCIQGSTTSKVNITASGSDDDRKDKLAIVVTMINL
jgi:hypothetical protein